MVKGVNKTIIEINDTENDVFEKVVLYVRPQYSMMKQRELEREANVIIKNYSLEEFDFQVNEDSPRNKRFLILLFGVMFVAAIAALFLIF